MLPFVFLLKVDLIIVDWYKIEISVYGRPFLTSDSNHLASNNHIIWTFSISYLVYIAIIVLQKSGIRQVVCITLLLLGILVVLLQFAYKDFIYSHFKRLLQNCITPYLPLVIQSASFFVISSASPFGKPVQTSAFYQWRNTI